MEVVVDSEVDIFHVNLLPDNVPELTQADLDLITELWLLDLDDTVPRPNRADNVEEDENDSSDDDAVAPDQQDNNVRDQQQQQPAQDIDAPDADYTSLAESVASKDEALGNEEPAPEVDDASPEADIDGQPEENENPVPPPPATTTTSGRSIWASFLSGFLYPSVFLSAIANAVISPREPQVAHCVVCDEDVTSFVRLPCKDVYCVTCLCQLFELSTNDESLMPPQCCRTVIPLKLVTSHLQPPLMNKFKQKLEEHNTLNRLYCVRPPCAAFLGSADGPRRIVRCPTCCAWVCTSCKKAGHPSFCKQDRETESAIEFCYQQGWQRCPGCQKMIELAHGCYHMTCVCRTEFCYLCRARWKSCACPQWDEGRLLITAEERGQDEIRRAVPNPVLPPQLLPARLEHNNNQPAQQARPQAIVPPMVQLLVNSNRAGPVNVAPTISVRDQIQRPLVVPNPIRPTQNNNQPIQRAKPAVPVDRRPLAVPNPIRPALTDSVRDASSGASSG